MDNKEFKTKALRTEPTTKQYREAMERLNHDGIGAALIMSLNEVQRNLEFLDAVKKYVFYGKANNSLNNFLASSLPTLKTGFPDVTRDNEEKGQSFGNSVESTRVLHGIVGMATESGELVEALLKIANGEQADQVNIMEEVGDTNWYEAILSDTLCFEVDEANERVINKLMKRFPDKFCEGHAKNRDLDSEREILEGNN